MTELISIKKTDNSWEIAVNEGGHGTITVTNEVTLYELHDQLIGLFKLLKELEYRPSSQKKGRGVAGDGFRQQPLRSGQKLRQDWADVLQDCGSQYTSVALQHQASAWRGDA